MSGWCEECETELRDDEEWLCEDCADRARRDFYADRKYDERSEEDPRDRDDW